MIDAYGWVLSYSVGLVTLAAAIYLWVLRRTRADGCFVLFLGLFFLHTFVLSFAVLPPVLIGFTSPVSALLYLSTLGIGVTLPLYVHARTGTDWLGPVWRINLAVSVLLAAGYVLLWTTETVGPLARLQQGLRVYIALVIAVSVTPLLRSRPADVSGLPPKAYRVAGIIAVAFAAALILPVILARWGLDVEIDPSLLYLGFYGLLQMRFLTILLPKLGNAALEKEKRREASLARYAVTAREREIYDLLAKGYTYKEIGRLLRISLSTVKTHVDHLYKKTDTGNKAQLIHEIEG